MHDHCAVLLPLRNNNKKVIRNKPPAYSFSLNVPIMLTHSLMDSLASRCWVAFEYKVRDQQAFVFPLIKVFGVVQSQLTQWRLPPKPARGVARRELIQNIHPLETPRNKIRAVNHISLPWANGWTEHHKVNHVGSIESTVEYFTALHVQNTHLNSMFWRVVW